MNNLNSYILNPENALNNFWLAREYEGLGQKAASVSFYLRAAERTTDDSLSYKCLLSMARIFENLQNNAFTVTSLYMQALTLKPKQPEAYYFLSRIYEIRQEYTLAYMTAKQALCLCDFSNEEFSQGYPGKYGIIFELAVSAWWVGKPKESRELFMELAEQYSDQLDETHKASVQNNLSRLGVGPESQAFTPYDISKHVRLKVKFPGSDNILKNFSQVYQDMFVLTMLNGKRKGTYLEIGAADPFHGNNTALLETGFDWTGVSIEYNSDLCNRWNGKRKNQVRCKNALDVDYKKLLREISSGDIDYLQLDCEPSKITFEILLLIPFERCRFGVITYEHDHYIDIDKIYRDRSRKYLEMMGYELIASDISPDGISSFEDWWVHPDMIDKDLIDIMKDLNGTKKAENYMLNGTAN